MKDGSAAAAFLLGNLLLDFGEVDWHDEQLMSKILGKLWEYFS